MKRNRTECDCRSYGYSAREAGRGKLRYKGRDGVSGMDRQRIFEILGIEETKEEERIREAYRSKLVSVNPEDNPEGFKRLREAYERALSLARQ